MGFFSRFWRRPVRILVVEDNPEISDLVREVLTANGYEVTTAQDGVKGFACFRQEKFDLLILDYNMPRMDGAEMLQLIRGLPRGKKQRVIMLSAERLLDPIYKAYDHGIVEWIPKPFTAAVLLAKVNSHLTSRGK